MLAGAMLASSCEDAEVDPPQERLFRPVAVSGTAVANTIELTWSAIPDAVSYKVDYSSDPTFATDVRSVDVLNAKNKYLFTALEYYTNYYFRLTAISGITATANSNTTQTTEGIRTKEAPTVLYPVAAEDKGDDWVVLRWNTAYIISKISLVSDDGTSYSHDFVPTPADVANGYVRVSGLAQLAYTASAYGEDGIKLNSVSVNLLAPLLPVEDADIFSTEVTVRWKAGPAVTKVVLTPSSGAAITQNITAATLSQKITGLTPLTNYTVQIFIGDTPCNKVTFRSWYAIPTVYTNVASGSNLMDAMDAASDGDVLMLASNATYTASKPGDATGTYKITKALTIMSRSPGNKPVVTLSKAMDMDGVITAFKSVGVSWVAADASTAYFVNVTNAATALNLTSFELRDSQFDGFGRSLFRSQKTTANQTIGTLLIDRCYAKNMNDGTQNYAVLHIQATAAAVAPRNYTVTNSTFNVLVSLIQSKVSATSTKSTYTISNCTFNNMGDGTTNGRYFIDLTMTTGNTDEINMNSCIFGRIKGSATYKGIRAGGATMNMSNNDAVSGFATSSDPIPGLVTLSEGYYDVFKDPDNGDFTLKPKSLIDAKVGDPRWIPAQ